MQFQCNFSAISEQFQCNFSAISGQFPLTLIKAAVESFQKIQKKKIEFREQFECSLSAIWEQLTGVEGAAGAAQEQSETQEPHHLHSSTLKVQHSEN